MIPAVSAKEIRDKRGFWYLVGRNIGRSAVSVGYWLD